MVADGSADGVSMVRVGVIEGRERAHPGCDWAAAGNCQAPLARQKEGAGGRAAGCVWVCCAVVGERLCYQGRFGIMAA